ncbi:hypothetical protein RF55_6093 [Lasius niger]|uniref:Uncharacterized protein n=1 Tax=Lasius niger TaxID=67767 RepID=A0A0J7KU13_LASNI|nr:hypothetical protein RF55_6091 [Lasius niger]KMQ93783.1 hypothetical protein RF55_6093 [Lasius niger]
MLPHNRVHRGTQVPSSTIAEQGTQSDLFNWKTPTRTSVTQTETAVADQRTQSDLSDWETPTGVAATQTEAPPPEPGIHRQAHHQPYVDAGVRRDTPGQNPG